MTPPKLIYEKIRKYNFTTLTFTAGDGTEYELRDSGTGGQPLLYVSCPSLPGLSYSPGANRGRVFSSTDGSAVTFISDSDIYDNVTLYDPGQTFVVSGYLMLRDGTRYRIDGGNVTWIRDRNGNKLSFAYDANHRPISITDSLNRVVTIAYDVQDVAPYGLCDKITWKGAGGVERALRISKTSLGNALRADFTLQSYKALFPELDGGFVVYDPTMVSALWLPDNRSYQFRYNSYAELARIVLPTGGAVEYDMVPGSGVVGRQIYRRVLKRRILPDGITVASETTWNATQSSVTDPYPWLTTVSVEQRDGAGALLARNVHYFKGSALASMIEHPFQSRYYIYPAWDEGREIQTDTLNAAGAVQHRINNSWQQRASVPWWGSWVSTWNLNAAREPANDPRLTVTTTSMMDVSPNLVAQKTFNYDQYNNQTDVYEYDFGAGAPGPLIRRTHTEYLTTNPWQGNVNYAADLNIHIRNLPTYTSVSDGSGVEISKTWFDYDAYGINGLPALQDCPGIVQHDGGFHTGYGARGNLLKITRLATTAPTYVVQHFFYDIAGNVVQKTDGFGTPTMIDYRDNFGTPDDPAVQSSENPANNAPGELGGQMSYAFPFKITNALGHKTYTKYDYYLGRPALSEDANGVKSNIYFNDALDRPTSGVRAIGTSVASQTVFIYNDSGSPVNGYPARSITTISDKDVFGESNSGNGLKSISLYDGLGRAFRGAAYEGSTWTIKDTQFDALGRVSQISNPYRAVDPGSASPPAGLWTTTNYDSLSRVIQVTTPDSAHVDTAYSGNQVTVTDQSGKKRRSETDGLGRLVKVTEDPGDGGLNYDTTYLYDALGNLRKVTQGAQTRWFAYDSLSRVIRVRNPEQSCNSNLPPHTDPFTGGNCWATAYSYDANGNLTQRIDARGVVTNYFYDALNRNWGIDYINGSQASNVFRAYDGAVNGKGRLYWERTQEGGAQELGANVTAHATDSYDALGRPLQKRQYIWRAGADWGPGYYMQQTYDLAGNVKTVTYPSGHTVNYSYDQVGRLNSFTGNLGGGQTRTYSTITQYHPAGMIERETFSTQTPLYHKKRYNNRLQFVDLRLSTANDELSWDRGALTFYYGWNGIPTSNLFADDPTNNGNLVAQITYVPTSGGGIVVPQGDAYYYDALNRITGVNESQIDANNTPIYNVYTQNFSYDRWGNRQITSATGGVNNYNPIYDQATNRINGLGYDAAGNIISDPMTGGTMTYDAENRLQTATNGVVGSSYTYDADGGRVKRIIGGLETWHVYGIGGELLAEYGVGAAPSAPQKEYGYRNGQLLVVWDGSETGDGQLQWLVQDHLGSTRMVVDRSGGLGGIRRHDFLPFGEELSAGVGIRSAALGYGDDAIRQKFDGYERDPETNLDFAEARYFASMQGRFTSPDPFLSSGQVDDPQSWNRYSFGLNNPLRYTDPFGLYVFDSSVTEEQRKKFREGLAQARKDLTKIGEKYGTNSGTYKKAQRALDVYGDEETPQHNNGVTIRTQQGAGLGHTSAEGVAGQKTADNPNGQNIRVEFDASAYEHRGLSNLIGHEGSHAADASEWVSSGFAASKNPTRYKTEVEAYTVTSLLLEARGGAFPTMLPHYRNRRGVVTYLPDQIYMYNSSWAEADKATLRRANIDRFLERPRYAGGIYGVTPNSPGGKAFRRGSRF